MLPKCHCRCSFPTYQPNGSGVPTHPEGIFLCLACCTRCPSLRVRIIQMNPCEDFDSHLLLYLDNALDPQETENMRAHLQTCANCRARLEEEQELSRLLKRSRPLYSAPQQLRARVSAIERESVSIPAPRENGGTVCRGLRPGKCWYPPL